MKLRFFVWMLLITAPVSVPVLVMAQSQTADPVPVPIPASVAPSNQVAVIENNANVLAFLPEDPRYDAPITISTSIDGSPLREFVAAISRSIGLIPIVDAVPADVLIFDYEFEATPFRQVFRIVLGLNNLDYILDANNVVIIGDIETITGFRAREPLPEPVAAAEVELPEPEDTGPVIPTEQRFFRVSDNAEGFAIAISSAIPEAEVTVIEGISSLSVTATNEQLQQVRAILDELDPPPAQALIIPTFQRIYTLENARAEELAKVLKETVPEKSEGSNGNTSSTTISINGPETGASTTSNNIVEQPQFTVTPDVRTNALIINATEKQHEQFAEIIPRLDVPQPQINVQIRIQEISKTAALNLGVDLNAGFGNFSATLLETGLNFVFDAQRAISGLNIGAVLDTLERQGLSRRVDDATLTVLNNGEAVMQAGGSIEINLVGDGTQAIQRTIPYGVQINVTPQIAGADGDIINLNIEAKVSDILSNTNDPTFIQFSDRNVSSTLSLNSGQTVLLGGLFQNQFKETITGVPILSSLPVVGPAFSRTSNEESDVEILLIVTADIVNRDDVVLASATQENE